MIKRRKKQRMGLRESSVVRCPGYLKWLRGCDCILPGKYNHKCEGRIEAHHLQSLRAIEGGMGMKVGDNRCVPLCSLAHQEIHSKGQPEFERYYSYFPGDLEDIAEGHWHHPKNTHRVAYERKQNVS